MGLHASFLLVKNFQKKLTPNGSGGSNFCLWPKSYIIKAKWLQNSELRMMDGILEWNEELNLQVPKVLGGSRSGRTARRRSENQRKNIYIKIGCWVVENFWRPGWALWSMDQLTSSKDLQIPHRFWENPPCNLLKLEHYIIQLASGDALFRNAQ